jgi:hypothetical protein
MPIHPAEVATAPSLTHTSSKGQRAIKLLKSLLHNRLRERLDDVLWCVSVLTALANHDSIVAFPRHGPSNGAPFS